MKSLILSDIHANLPALEAVLDAEQWWDEILFLGDVAVIGPYHNETIDLLTRYDGLFISGNHDRAAVEAPAHITPSSAMYPLHEAARQQLTPENRRILAGFLPPQCIERDGRRFALHHGDFPHEHGNRLWPDTPETVYARFAASLDAPTILFGHCHVQFRIEAAGRTFVNPGSIGSQRLGRPLACYAVLADGDVTLKAVPYDVERLCRKMADEPLDPGLIADWQHGYRTGTLPPRYKSRDWAPLIAAGWR